MSELATAISTPPPRVARRRDDVAGWSDAPNLRRHARERRLARDLVELSRLQRGGERAACAPFDLAALVRAICADYPQLYIDGPQHLRVITDSRRISRLLFALLDNAYLHGAPPVSVSYDMTELAVHDSGPGFSASLLEHATEPFVTGERTRGRGVGLGLAIAARQAALLDGGLDLSNGPGGGAVARLHFAVGAPVAGATSPTPQP